ncbi:Myb-like DNA-binding domain containing protein [Histomonas meleagridis]|uniref:Myb-like DNA-binding domain containing protein n=1 Tax=Histomonas meleagridis TaxID=135588 RepID=UPI00355A50BC|nr:Myb-like DNA-binding domain containing protein [Histomonas meleagridis]KAH0800511.1 Myb-like DNA-binding domain containing protein [Histomonas meleagridis]
MESNEELNDLHQPSPKTRHCVDVKFFANSHWSKDEDHLLIKVMSKKQIGRTSWNSISHMFPGKENQQIANRWRNVINPDIKKGSWTQEEDQFILDWVETNGAHQWDKCASKLGKRVGKQCRERWLNHLCDASRNNRKWTLEDDEQLISMRNKVGNKWTFIAKSLGRTENQVKNRWYSTLQRRISRIENGYLPDFKRGRKKSTNMTNYESIKSIRNDCEMFEIPDGNYCIKQDNENEILIENDFIQEANSVQQNGQIGTSNNDFEMFLQPEI